MELYPAIDIHRGQVVRASRADLSSVTVYHRDPFVVAEQFVEAGARWVHVVDLDRAFSVGDQTALVAALVKRLPVPVQLGGGLWTADDVAELRDVGVQRILLGARAVADPASLAELADLFAEDCLGLALDVKDGRVWARGWSEASDWLPEDVAGRARDAGIRVLAVTELAHEGRLGGADIAGATALARATGMDVIVSGGVSSLADLERLQKAGMAGAIVGRALFEKQFTIGEALACLSS
jgi:phosphoribosylformimino-5-aminoimidazole carboxamide ribotide isomerase